METDFMRVDEAPSKPWKWSNVYKLRLADVKKVVMDREMYWPLGVRQIYYGVISQPGFKEAWYWKSQKGKTKGQPLANYCDTVGELLKWGRLGETEFFEAMFGFKGDHLLNPEIPMEAINDEGRQVSGKVGFSSTRQFFQQQIKSVFNGYSACLAENQERNIEVWIEKQGLFHIINPTVQDFCRQALAVPGYPSVTVLADYALRVSGKNNPTILYFGDLDVDGIEIPRTFLTSLREEHGVYDVEVIRCGLNPKQVEDLNADPVEIKGSAKVIRNFISEYGNRAYELDAVPPDELQDLVYSSLLTYTDMEILEQDNLAGKKDRKKFDELQDSVEVYAKEQAVKAGLIL